MQHGPTRQRLQGKSTLAARAAGWRGGNALKALYLALAQQWLEIAIIGDAADQERAIERLSDV